MAGVAEYWMEKAFMKEHRENLIIAWQELNFLWDDKNTRELDRLWKEGYEIDQIAKYFKRSMNEIGLMVAWRISEGHIKGKVFVTH